MLLQTPVTADVPSLKSPASSPSAGLKLKTYLAVLSRPASEKPHTPAAILPTGSGAKPKRPSTSAAHQLEWFPASRWNSFAFANRRVRLRLIVRNTNHSRKLFGGELRWIFCPWSGAAIPPATANGAIQRERIAPTQIAALSAVALNFAFRTHRVGRYYLVWQSGDSRKILAQVMCLVAPTGLRTPVAQSHWISVMPPLAPGAPDRHFALQVASLVMHSGIKRYWLTLTTGDPINRRQHMFSTALRTLRGHMLLRIIYPITPSNLSQLLYTATSRWLEMAVHRLSAIADIEPVFLVQPQDDRKYLPLMEKIFASDLAIAQSRHIHTLLPSRSFNVFEKKYRDQAAGVVIPESATWHPLPTKTRAVNSSLPIWALPSLRQRLNSDRSAARLFHDPAVVVGVAAPWIDQNGGWLIHILGNAVWLQNQSIPGWGNAAIFAAAHKSVAVISRFIPPEAKTAWNLHKVWLPNRMVGTNIFNDLQLQPYESGSYMQVADPDSSITVFNLHNQLLVPLYPGLPRIPAADAEAILISRESAGYLLAALRIASIHVEPHITSITFATHDGKHPATKPLSHGAPSAATKAPPPLRRRMVIRIDTHATQPPTVQVAAVIDGHQYKLVDPSDVSFSARQQTLRMELQLPKHCKEFLIALHGQRRTWLAKLTPRATKK